MHIIENLFPHVFQISASFFFFFFASYNFLASILASCYWPFPWIFLSQAFEIRISERSLSDIHGCLTLDNTIPSQYFTIHDFFLFNNMVGDL
jgi:hypothetical protein